MTSSFEKPNTNASLRSTSVISTSPPSSSDRRVVSSSPPNPAPRTSTRTRPPYTSGPGRPAAILAYPPASDERHHRRADPHLRAARARAPLVGGGAPRRGVRGHARSLRRPLRASGRGPRGDGRQRRARRGARDADGLRGRQQLLARGA